MALMKGEQIDAEGNQPSFVVNMDVAKQKFLTEVTPNYYGEYRRSPTRLYVRDMSPTK
jgi:hypothetical protein